MSADQSARGVYPDIGPALRDVRTELKLTQTDVGLAMGFSPAKTAQSLVSQRERTTDPRYLDPTAKELARFEDANGLPRGTVLRRAGYVDDPDTPLEQVDSWTFLPPALRAAVKRMVEEPWEQAGRPGLSHRRR